MFGLKSEIWVSALLRRAQSAGAFACLLRKGHADAGAVLIKVRRSADDFRLFRPQRNMAGDRVWWQSDFNQEADLDALINRRIDDDPDIWVVEIEDKDGRSFLTEPIMSD